jgi:hypothetical protein
MNARHYEASDDTRGILGRERMRANVVVGAWLLRARIPVIMEGESPSSKKLKTEVRKSNAEVYSIISVGCTAASVSS